MIDDSVSPYAKKTRFSEHPQVFEYSSSKNKQEEADNQSLLLDTDDIVGQQNFNKQLKKFEKGESQSKNIESMTDFEQMTTGFEEIENYLKQDSQPAKTFITPQVDTKYKQITTQMLNNEKPRFSLNLKAEFGSGRETMNLAKQSQIKNRPKDDHQQMSNNKKRAQELEKQEENYNNKIIEEFKKKQRITMDCKDLVSMVDMYEKNYEARKSQHNRITLDMFTLNKLLEEEAEGVDKVIEESEAEDILTPIREKKSKIFSAYKQGASQQQISLSVQRYLLQIKKRLAERKKQNQYLTNIIHNLTQQHKKAQIKLSNIDRQNEKTEEQIKKIQYYMRQKGRQLEKINYKKSKQTVKDISQLIDINIFKYQNFGNWNFCGYFYFQGIFVKVKSRGKDIPPEIKLMNASFYQYFEEFVLTREDILHILKRYFKLKMQANSNLLQIIIYVKRIYNNLRQLDQSLFYISQSLDLSDMEFQDNLDNLIFKVRIGNKSQFIIELNLMKYLESPESWNSIKIYNVLDHNYLQVESKAISKSNVLFETATKLIEQFIK